MLWTCNNQSAFTLASHFPPSWTPDTSLPVLPQFPHPVLFRFPSVGKTNHPVPKTQSPGVISNFFSFATYIPKSGSFYLRNATYTHAHCCGFNVASLFQTTIPSHMEDCSNWLNDRLFSILFLSSAFATQKPRVMLENRNQDLPFPYLKPFSDCLLQTGVKCNPLPWLGWATYPLLPKTSWFKHWKSHIPGNSSVIGKKGQLVTLSMACLASLTIGAPASWPHLLTLSP